MRELNRRLAERSLSTADAAAAVALLLDLDRVLAIARGGRGDAAGRGPGAARRSGRRASGRDWARSDALRAELAALGVAVEDTKDGQRWRPMGGPDAPA